MSDALTNCPKCGFNQPVDQYCANCGVDMLAAKQKSASSFSSVAKQPAAIAAFAVAAIAIAFGASRMMRRAPGTDEAGTSRLASQSRARKENLSQEASPQMRQSIENKMNEGSPASQAAGTIALDGGARSNPNDSSSTQVHFHQAGETAATLPPPGSKPTPADAAAAAPTGDELQVAFAWTEVSRDWLQAMSATDPGLHRVPDLEGRLRDSKGAYRILEVSKQKIAADTSTFTIRRGDRDGDRSNLKVDISAVTESGFAGTIQVGFRGPDGGVRAPAAAALAIEKGQGSILTFPPVPPPPGVAPSASNEIVVLILPRWGADRNP